MKPRSSCSAITLTMMLSVLLTGCGSVSSGPKASPSAPLNIYQPRVLLLKAGQPIQTAAGIYTPQTDETWHSPAAFEALEQETLNLSAALAQERARTK
ncbi:hypothetical protein K0B96_06575 [Horticoccus luteus]|uniref:Uncharacterized protein n=1 Tax=Horticoccus luteus TaxID=2862869 RepID=A0A8F9XMP9_9BACT|nr:hypothetical protein [Horticoccus luteus]QYM80274.1 hypothetical protein K0B96_06575 [Horticoccus luteus]